MRIPVKFGPVRRGVDLEELWFARSVFDSQKMLRLALEASLAGVSATDVLDGLRAYRPMLGEDQIKALRGLPVEKRVSEFVQRYGPNGARIAEVHYARCA